LRVREDVIAIDASRAATSSKTGTEWYSVEIIRALAAIEERPILTLYERPGTTFAVDQDGVRHRTVNIPRLWTHLGLSSAMIRDRPAALFVPSHVIPLAHPGASVVTVHDLGYLFEPAAHPPRSRMMLDLTTRWNARVARRIIAVSEQTRRDLVERYRVAAEKIAVAHSGVNLDRFHATAYGHPSDPPHIPTPYLLFLSTVQPRKNLIRLIEAFEMLDRPDLHLVVGGKPGWLSGPSEERILRSSARSRIIRLGHVPDETVPSLYNAAEAFVLPSLYEGFGMGIFEAMASACPVVTSNVSSMPEVAGGAAVLVNPHDPASIRDGILRAIDPAIRPRLIKEGLERVSEFTWERAARQTMAVIQDAMRA
jgi:glycosyltransferase involved in cell wall biosynthesis